MEHEPRLAVVVPTLNEAQNIHRCICSLLVQLPPTATIVVADGGSVDNTLSLIAEFCKLDSRVSIIHNRARIQSAAVNLVAGMLLDHADVLVRADAHAIYPPTFLASLIKAFRTSGAQSVVVPMRAVGKSLLQKAIAATQNSRLGNGGASHRGEARSGFVDHGHHALFDLRFFQQLGGYDVSFTHNEDFEYDYRVGLAGGRIYMCAEAAIEYLPRDSFSALARQYYNHGRGRAFSLLKHRLMPRIRQLLPVAVLLTCLCSFAASVLYVPAILIPASYVSLCLGWGLLLAIRARQKEVIAAAPAAMIMHLSWAYGFSMGVWEYLARLRRR